MRVLIVSSGKSVAGDYFKEVSRHVTSGLGEFPGSPELNSLLTDGNLVFKCRKDGHDAEPEEINRVGIYYTYGSEEAYLLPEKIKAIIEGLGRTCGEPVFLPDNIFDDLVST